MRDDSAKRRVREGTSRAMRSKVRHCAECGRGQVPHMEHFGGGIAWTCRYCGHENGHITKQPCAHPAWRVAVDPRYEFCTECRYSRRRCNCPSMDDVFRHGVGTKPPCPVHPEPEFPPGTYLPAMPLGEINVAPLPRAMTEERGDG